VKLRDIGQMTGTLPFVFLFLVGCAPASVPSGTTPRPMVAPTRSAEECAPLVAQVRAHSDSFQQVPPQLRGIAIPPMEGTPRELRGAHVVIRILVDEVGAQVADSLVITPSIASPGFDRELRRTIAQYRFFPAVLEGCAVPGRTMVELILSNR
jgi:outer membrane biosynthesis protein TonB